MLKAAFGSVFLLGAALAACYANPGDEDATGGANAARGAGEPTVRGSTTTAGADLSCELATLLATRCQKCHGEDPVKGAKLSMLGRADLVAPSPDDPKQTVIALALARMKDREAPMPPSPEAPASASEIALVERWIAAGTPAESCGAAETPKPPPRAEDPFDTPTVCTSKKTWTNGDHGSEEMHPGHACISCHAKNIKTLFKASFDVAGTVFPSAHEPDDCYGVAGGGVTVVITGADNVEYKLPVNASGNFAHETTLGLTNKIPMPYRAKVVRNGVERVMKDPQTNGDCNSCHTEKGTNLKPSDDPAPGRIVAP